MQEAKDLAKMRGWLFQLLTPEEKDGNLNFKVRPNSLEGVIKAYKDVTVLLQAYRAEVMSKVEPLAPTIEGDSSDDDVGPFSTKEAGMMARTILKDRMEQRQLVAHEVDESEHKDS
jgi:hypothetical protein